MRVQTRRTLLLLPVFTLLLTLYPIGVAQGDGGTANLRVSLPAGTFINSSNPDPWLDEGWLLNLTGNSWSFNVRVTEISNAHVSYDTHLIVVLNNASYENIIDLTINGTTILKEAFQYGTPEPYKLEWIWPDDVYPTWFNDTFIFLGTIQPFEYKEVNVSATFSDPTDARVHFDAYGRAVPGEIQKVGDIIWTPNSEDSTVVSAGAPPAYGTLNVTTTPVAGEVFVDGESWGTASQSRVIQIGTYNVSFGDVAGYYTPSWRWATVYENLETTVEGIYEPVTGFLTVMTTPVSGEVFVNGTSWGIAPQSKVVQVGTYNISFGDVARYYTPTWQLATVYEGVETNVTGVYEPITGTLAVTTTPVSGEVFVNGTSWGLAPQSRTIQVGTYNVSFGDVAGYYTPAWQPATVYENLETTVEGVYELLPVHDLAVVSVWVEYPWGANQTTGIYPGWVVNISVTVRNNGTVTESFTVTAYYDTNIIGTPQTVTDLDPGNEMTLTFVWNTTGVAYSLTPYTVNATVSGVPYEIDTTNNSFITTIGVKMPGDVDWSGKCDWIDLGKFALAYGGTYPDSPYNPAADFDGSGKVDWKDLGTLALNYGKTYT